MLTAPELYIRKMTRREFRRRMVARELVACIIPLAAVEQHLEHLAMEHDWRSVSSIAHEVALRLQPKVVIADPLLAGISEHHMRHPGTLSLRPSTFLAVLEDLVDSVSRAGFKHILVLNGHGGNIAPCQSTWDQLLRRFQLNIHFLSYWDTLTASDAQELLRSGSRLPQDLPGHAQEFETAFALAAFPENVRTDAVADQPDPTPALATAATGRAFIERVVPRVAEYLEEMISGRRPAFTPPFHP